MAKPVQLAGADAGLDVFGDEIEHFARQAASDAHLFNIFGGFDVYGHDRLNGVLEAVVKLRLYQQQPGHPWLPT